jgi:hypothetical protein
MTSSKFAGKLTIKLPIVCRPSLVGLRPDYASGEPNKLSAYAYWKQHDPDYQLSASFCLHQVAAPFTWSGATTDQGLNLAATVQRIGNTDYFHFLLILRIGTATIDTVQWMNVPLKPRPPFDSGLLTAHYPPPYTWTELHVKD